MQQKILQKYYSIVLFRCYPYEEHDKVVAAVESLGGKHLQEYLGYQQQYDVKQYPLG